MCQFPTFIYEFGFVYDIKEDDSNLIYSLQWDSVYGDDEESESENEENENADEVKSID